MFCFVFAFFCFSFFWQSTHFDLQINLHMIYRLNHCKGTAGSDGACPSLNLCFQSLNCSILVAKCQLFSCFVFSFFFIQSQMQWNLRRMELSDETQSQGDVWEEDWTTEQSPQGHTSNFFYPFSFLLPTSNMFSCRHCSIFLFLHKPFKGVLPNLGCAS